MIIVCPSCQTCYQLNDQLVTGSEFLARCSRCSQIFSAYRPVQVEDTDHSNHTPHSAGKRSKDFGDSCMTNQGLNREGVPSIPISNRQASSFVLRQVSGQLDITDNGHSWASPDGCKGIAQTSSRNWAAARSQVHDGRFNDESDIVLGFDFGTSSSKIVIRDSGRQTAYAVPFGELGCKGNRYLIPAKLYIGEDGAFGLEPLRFSCDRLKLLVMENPDGEVLLSNRSSNPIKASDLAVAYMAMVIRHARLWFLEHTAEIYKKTHIQWQINLGIPSSNYEDEKKCIRFKHLAMAAWRISMFDNPILITQVKEIVADSAMHIASQGLDIPNNEINSVWLHPDFVGTHPEVIMEIVGYARSPLRNDGLHLLVDIGASTMDVATFIIHSDEGEDKFPILETAVDQYGTMVLHEKRIRGLKNNLDQALQSKGSIDPTGALPDLTYYEVSMESSVFTEIDNQFFKACAANIGNVIRNTKNNRAPYARAWSLGLPVFICGGGSRIEAYRTMLRNLGSRIAKGISDFKGFDIRIIPKPDQLEAPDISHHEYDRLAVAYGLSFSSLEIGEVISRDMVSDIQKEDRTKNVDALYIGNEMV
jgi:predicted Zn finger-like uncharacterized protein